MSRVVVSRSATEEFYSDGRSFSATAVREITQEWVDKQMEQKISEFTANREVTIFTGTWNVNAKKQEGSLSGWLLHHSFNANKIDIYAVGFQEIVDLNAMNVALDSSKTSQRTQFWQEKISEALEILEDRYVCIGSKALVGLLLCVYVKGSLLEHISDVRINQVGVGLMGMMGNKGGVAIRMNIYDSSVVFVCSHLAAHRENVVGRNSDFSNIMEKMLFPSEEKSKRYSLEDGSHVRPKFGAQRYHERDLKIGDHEVIIWIGDLNYRLEQELELDDIFNSINRQDWNTLLQYDQLNLERKKGTVFQQFLEGEVKFPPTYKYQPGTDEYDRRPEKKVRAPAWCDRILWRVNSSQNSLTQRIYQRANLLPSDHKPVLAVFDGTVKIVVETLEDKVYNDIEKNLTYWSEKDAVPSVVLEGAEINFGPVKYATKYSKTFRIKNDGRVVAPWRLVNKVNEKTYCKRFLTFSVSRGLLFPQSDLIDAV